MFPLYNVQTVIALLFLVVGGFLIYRSLIVKESVVPLVVFELTKFEIVTV